MINSFSSSTNTSQSPSSSSLSLPPTISSPSPLSLSTESSSRACCEPAYGIPHHSAVAGGAHHHHRHQLASARRQFLILTWKNSLLLSRNLAGIFFELVLSVLIVSMLLVTRHFIENVRYGQQQMPAYNVIDFFFNNLDEDIVLVYPSESAVALNVVTRAFRFITSEKWWYNVNIQSTNVSNPRDLNTKTLQKLVAHIAFPDYYNFTLPDHVEYKLTTKEETNSDEYLTNTNFYPRSYFLYKNSPEFYCQERRFFNHYNKLNSIKYALDLSIIQELSMFSINNLKTVKIKQLDCPGFHRDELKSSFGFLPPLIVQIGFMFTLLINLGYIVREKQNKMKEYLKIVGVKSWVYWLSFTIRSLVIYTLLSILVTVIGAIELSPRLSSAELYTRKSLFASTSFYLVFLTCFFYSIQVTLITLLIAQFFNKPFMAKIFTIIFWLVTTIDFYGPVPSPLKYILCFIPNIALNFAFKVIFQFERSDKSLNITTLFTNLFGDSLNLGAILVFMLFWSAAYVPFIWYFEKILPGQFGVPLPFYFVFMPSYWLEKFGRGNWTGGVLRSKRFGRTFSSSNNNNNSNGRLPLNRFCFQPEPYDLRPTVRMRDISKKFRVGFKKKTTVKNISLNLYENQITGFLGHNGAGKTTTIFMLCGIYQPCSGEATILGYNIKTKMNTIRASIGFCPQMSILYDELTVYEHLYLIASIKGICGNALKSEIDRIGKLVGLEQDMSKRAKNLSGGMRRRLSIGMALIGDSKVIILDEPCSGLDPMNRRLVWSLIQKYKFNKTIILTTHYMEEADVLCDRIAIMNRGEVKCCGDPYFLKQNLGKGFKLVVYKAANFSDDVFKNIVELFDARFTIETDVAAEISIFLPNVPDPDLVELLCTLEENKYYIGIDSYAISTATIEEVFLKIGQIREEETPARVVRVIGDVYDETYIEERELSSVFNPQIKTRQGVRLFAQQIKALVLKRVRIFMHRYLLASIILLAPITLECFFCLIIPSQTYLMGREDLSNAEAAAASTVVRFSDDYKLGLESYGPFRMPHYINGSTYSQLPLRDIISRFYALGFGSPPPPPLQLVELGTANISGFVLDERLRDLRLLVDNFYVAMSLNLTSPDKLFSTLYYSSLAFHSSSNVLHEWSNLYLSFLINKPRSKSISTWTTSLYTRGSEYEKSTSNDESAVTSDFLKDLACLDILPSSIINLLNSLLIALITSLTVITISRERVTGSKSQQLLTGTHFLTYWLSNYLFDLAVFLLEMAAVVAAIKLIDSTRADLTSETTPLATSPDALAHVFFLFFLAAFASCSLAYVWSFFFKSEMIGFVVLVILLGVAAFLDMIAAFVQIFVQVDSKERSLNVFNLMNGLRYAFMVLCPNVTVKRGLYYLKIRQSKYCIKAINRILDVNYSFNEPSLSFKEPGLGWVVVILALQFVAGNLLLVLLELKDKINFNRFIPRFSCCCCCSPLWWCSSKSRRQMAYRIDETIVEMDPAVRNEAYRIQSLNMSQLTDPVVVKNLVKKFKKNGRNFSAVNNINFGIGKGECFGILGLNGAGKTTLIRMLVGELKSTRGTIFINGHDMNKCYTRARKNLGYCPQFSKLPDFLLVRECLELFADLKGLSSCDKPVVLEDLIKLFRLGDFRHRMVQHLSEGNKKKLSAALAFLGRPQVVILDEPTTGMDPGSRRYFWNLIRKARKYGVTTILSSHSMEECEALCSELVIMKNGGIRCIGTTKYIKSKYGNGFSLMLKCRPQIEPTNEIFILEQFLMRHIPNAVVKDKQQESIMIQIESDTTTGVKPKMADIFNLILTNRQKLNIESIHLSETTLEQVFLMLTKSNNNNNNSNNNINNNHYNNQMEGIISI